MSAIVVITTVGTEEQAKLISNELVRRRNAACVNILPVVRSVYRWQGKVCEDSEFMLVIKTLEAEFEAVQVTIQDLHQYEVPEILCFNVGKGSPTFLDWIAESVGQGEVAGDGAWPPGDDG